MLIFVSCNNDKAISVDNIINIKINPKSKNKEKNIENIIDSLYLIPLSNKIPIATITKMKIVSDRIFIFDDLGQNILIFDIKGELIGEIRNKGKGPNEYYKILDFDIDQDKEHILVLDQKRKRIQSYSYEGNFVSQKTISSHIRFFSKLKKGYFAIYNDYNYLSSNNYNVFILDKKGNVKSKYFSFEEKFKETNRGKDSYFTSSKKSSINYIGQYDNHIYNIDKDSIWASYYLDFGKFNIPNDVVHNKRNSLNDYAYNISNFYESSSHLTFSYIYDDVLNVVYYNKKEGILLPPFNIKNPLYSNFFFPVKAQYNDFFVTYVNPKIFKNFDKQKYDFPVKKNLTKYINLVKNISEDDNPIVYFFKFRKNEN